MAKEDYKGIWVFAEQQNGKLSNTPLEILAKAQELKAHTGEEITAVLLGHNVAPLADELIAYGADQVIVAEHPNLRSYSARPYQKVLTELAEKYQPSIHPLRRDLPGARPCPARDGFAEDRPHGGRDRPWL